MANSSRSQNSHAGVSDGIEVQAFEEIFFTSQDNLTLYARDYGAHHTDALPIVCLHGFSHNSEDFHELALHLAQTRRVIVPDLRGRGRSEYAQDKSTYTAFHEMLDVLDLLLIADVHQAVVLGTSRGGIIAMLMAAFRPTVLKAVILIDIGPVIEHKGLLRLSGQLNTLPKPDDWTHAREILSMAHGHALPGLSDEAWQGMAKRRFKETNHGLVVDYDPALAKTFSAEVGKAQVNPRTYWPLFTAITAFPGLLIHGELSELLSSKTSKEMAKRHKDLEVLTVKNRGHVPLLNEPGVVKAIDALIVKAERA